MRIPLLLAYLDPSSGSMWFQLILGGLLGTLAVLRQYWASVTALVRSIRGKARGF